MANDYDSFAEKRAQAFASGQNLVHTYIEKPAMYALLPNLDGASVLCIGCGTGEECAELRARDADVVGIDISDASIAYAKGHIPGVSFRVADMDADEDMRAFGEGSFDFVYSSLALHYSNDLGRLLRNVHRLLKPHGALLFSVGHPLRWASEVREDEKGKTVLMGYHKGPDGVEIFGDYLTTKQFTQQLSDGPKITYWMRPVSAYFGLLSETGFVTKSFGEPTPAKGARGIDEEFYELRSKQPVDMVFLAEKQ